MRIEALTSIRFFAALLVIFHNLDFLGANSSSAISHFYYSVLWEGFIGVTFFFILSGFILSHSYLERLQSKTVSSYEFILKRFARIYPLHLLCFILVIPLVYFFTDQSSFSFKVILTNTFLIQSYFQDRGIYAAFNSPTWSLSVEILFYISFPFLIARSNWFLIVLCLICTMWQVLIASSGLLENEKQFFIFIFPLSRLIDFLLGILLYRLFLQLKGFFRPAQVNLMQILSLALLLIFFVAKNRVDISFRYVLYYEIPMMLIIISFSFVGGLPAKILQANRLKLLGEASYSIFLINYIVISYSYNIKSLYWTNSNGVSDVFLALTIVLVSIILGVMMHLFVEKNIHRWLKRRYFS